MAYETISVAPIAGALGAEVSGVDLARKLPDATIAESRQAVLTHLVIFYGGTSGSIPVCSRRGSSALPTRST